MKTKLLKDIDTLISTVEWKHKELYEEILKQVEVSVKKNKQEQQMLKEYFSK